MPEVDYSHMRYKVNSRKKKSGNEFCTSLTLQSVHKWTSLAHDNVDERWTDEFHFLSCLGH